MSILQELNHREIEQVLLSAAERRLPLTITVREGEHWANYQSRLVGTKNAFLLVEMPVGDQGGPCEFSTGQNIGVGLKLKHHKYLFLAPVACQPASVAAAPGEGPLLVLGRPARMQRLQRRAYVRALVPGGCVARAAFWVGGHNDEPAGTSPNRPVWRGRVIDLSAGGFSVRTAEGSVHILDVGDPVGTRLIFGVGQEVVYADATVRHVAPDADGTVVGFGFLGLEYSEEGKGALQAISNKVNEFHAAAPREQPDEAEDESPRQCASRGGAEVATPGK